MSCPDCCSCCDCCATANIIINCGTENCNCCTPKDIEFLGSLKGFGLDELETFFLSNDSDHFSLVDFIARGNCTCPERIKFKMDPNGDFDIYCDGVLAVIPWGEVLDSFGDCLVGFDSTIYTNCTVTTPPFSGPVTIDLHIGCMTDEDVIIWAS